MDDEATTACRMPDDPKLGVYRIKSDSQDGFARWAVHIIRVPSGALPETPPADDLNEEARTALWDWLDGHLRTAINRAEWLEKRWNELKDENAALTAIVRHLGTRTGDEGIATTCNTHGPMLRVPDSELEPWQINSGRWWKCAHCKACGFLSSEKFQAWMRDPAAPADIRVAMGGEA